MASAAEVGPPLVLLLVKEEDMEMVAGRLYSPSSSSSSSSASSTSALANSYSAAAEELAFVDSWGSEPCSSFVGGGGFGSGPFLVPERKREK